MEIQQLCSHPLDLVSSAPSVCRAMAQSVLETRPIPSMILFVAS